MKKFAFLATIILALLLMSGHAVAGNFTVKEIMNVTLDDDPTAQNSDTLLTGGYDRMAFIVEYDETEVGGGLSVAITVQISHDNSTYQAASFYDYAGGATLQTTETISADGEYYFWFNRDICAPYVRVIATATGSDVDDTADVVITFAGKH